MLWTLTLKSVPVVPDDAIGQVKDPVPPLPTETLLAIVPISVLPFSRTSFTVDPGLPV